MKNVLKNLYSKDSLVLIILVCLFLLVRLTVLLSYMDKLFDVEELYHGTIAHEIISGPAIPLWEYLDYKVEYFPGGSLTAGILAVPFFLIFGHTYTALKLVGLTFALGTFILWFIFLKEFFNKKTAVIAGLLFIFCMPFYAKTSLVTWGSHPEANFFTALAIILFYRIFFKQDRAKPEDIRDIYKHKKLHFFLLGLVFGFGLWFVQSYFLTVIFLFLCWFIFDKGILLTKAFFILVAGFLIGFSPLLYYAVLYGTRIFDVNGRLFLADFIFLPSYCLPKLAAVLTKSLPQSFLFTGFLSIPGKLYSYLYYCIFLTAFLFLLWINRKSLRPVFNSLIYPVTLRGKAIMPKDISPETPLLIYPLLFFIGYSFSRYAVNPPHPDAWLDFIAYRYMVPVIPFILAILAVFLGKIKNILAAILLSVLLGLGIIGNLSMVSFYNFGRFLSDKGYSYNVLADKIAFRGPDNLKEYIRPFLVKLDDYGKSQFYDGIGSGIAWRLKDKKPREIMEAFEATAQKKDLPYLYRGWGSLFSLEIPEEFKMAVEVARYIPQEYKMFFYEGLGLGIGFTGDIEEAIGLLEKIDSRYRDFCYIGLGRKLGFEYKNDPRALRGMLSNIDSRYHQYVLDGIVEGRRER